MARERRSSPMNDFPRFLLYLFVMAAVTYLIRLLPMLLFRKKIKNRFMRSFLYYIPYSVLAVMAVPAFFHSTEFVISGVAACVVAVILAYFRRGLITVAMGSALTALIFELVIPLLI